MLKVTVFILTVLLLSLFILPAGATATGTDCLPSTDFSQAVELRVIQMRTGFSYTATVLGINGFDPSIWVTAPYDNGICVDDDAVAANYSAWLPTTGPVEASNTNAQVSFSYNGSEAFGNVSLWVASTNNQPGEFILVLEGLAVTDMDGIGDPLSLLITPGIINSGVTPTAYMLSRHGDVDSFVGLIDSEYNWLMDGDKAYIACDDAGSSCWGESSALNGAWIAMSDQQWVEASAYDAMLHIPVSEDSAGNFLNFVMRSNDMRTFGEYLAAFHIGIG
jgi:hypothetical protein